MIYGLLAENNHIMGYDPLNSRVMDEFWYPISQEVYDMGRQRNLTVNMSDELAQVIENYDNQRESYTDSDVPVIINVGDILPPTVPKKDIEIVRASHKNKNSTWCQEAIEFGVVMDYDNVRRRFPYTSEYQSNYKELLFLINEGILNESIPIKPADESSYLFVSAKDFKDIYGRLLKNKYYNLFYKQVLNEYIDTIDDQNKIERMTYEVALPEEFQKKLSRLYAPFDGLEV